MGRCQILLWRSRELPSHLAWGKSATGQAGLRLSALHRNLNELVSLASARSRASGWFASLHWSSAKLHNAMMMLRRISNQPPPASFERPYYGQCFAVSGTSSFGSLCHRSQPARLRFTPHSTAGKQCVKIHAYYAGARYWRNSQGWADSGAKLLTANS